MAAASAPCRGRPDGARGGDRRAGRLQRRRQDDAARAVANLLPACGGRITAGRVTYAGRDAARTRTDALVRGGLVGVLEGRHCFRGLSVEENLIAGGIGRGSGRAALRADLQRVYALFPRLSQKRGLPAGLVSAASSR